MLNNCSFPSCSQEGRDFGDEYLAELDHIGEYGVMCQNCYPVDKFQFNSENTNMAYLSVLSSII